MPDENLNELVNQIEQLRADVDDEFYPSNSDLKTFLKVLDFIRKLSVSRTGKIVFYEDGMRLSLDHYIDQLDLNEYGVVKQTALHQETEMNFVLENEDSLDDAVDDLLDSLDGLITWMTKRRIEVESQD